MHATTSSDCADGGLVLSKLCYGGMIGSILEIGHAGGLGGWVDAFVCVGYKNWFD